MEKSVKYVKKKKIKKMFFQYSDQLNSASSL